MESKRRINSAQPRSSLQHDLAQEPVKRPQLVGAACNPVWNGWRADDAFSDPAVNSTQTWNIEQ